MEYNRLSLKEFRSLFQSLQVPDPATLSGRWRAEFVGPAWLRASAGPALALSGLAGWWGKDIFPNGSAVNILLHNGNFSTRFEMYFLSEPSRIDGQPGLSIRYAQGNPFPWMFIVDELRRVNAATLLGLTIADVSGFRGMAFPFLLTKVE